MKEFLKMWTIFVRIIIKGLLLYPLLIKESQREVKRYNVLVFFYKTVSIPFSLHFYKTELSLFVHVCVCVGKHSQILLNVHIFSNKIKQNEKPLSCFCNVLVRTGNERIILSYPIILCYIVIILYYIVSPLNVALSL